MKNGLHIDVHGTKGWWLNGKLHLDDGPAVVWPNGTKLWYQNGKRHRLDGPAVECSDGSTGWHYNGLLLGYDAIGFWEHWDLLTHAQRCNLNLHFWLAKYT